MTALTRPTVRCWPSDNNPIGDSERDRLGAQYLSWSHYKGSSVDVDTTDTYWRATREFTDRRWRVAKCDHEAAKGLADDATETEVYTAVFVVIADAPKNTRASAIKHADFLNKLEGLNA